MTKTEYIVRFLKRPIGNNHGISSFSDWKFFAVLILYFASFMVFVRDPFFRLYGKVVFQQGMITLLLAVFLLNTLFWDFHLFGKPSGANLLLQVVCYFPGGILIARICGEATKPDFEKTILASLFSLAKGVIEAIATRFPSWVADLFSNWKITIVSIVLLMILSLNIRKGIKIGSIFLFLLVPFITETIQGECGYLLLGTFLFAVGMSLQFCRYDKAIYYEKIDDSLRQGADLDLLLLRCIIRIMSRLFQDSKISEQDVREIVAAEYNSARSSENGYSDMELNQIATGVTRKMIHGYNLVYISQSNRGSLMYPNQRLFDYDSILHGVAVWPRVIATSIFAVVWILSPIDILPDAIPFIGTLDDMFAGIATTIMITNAVQQERNS